MQTSLIVLVRSATRDPLILGLFSMNLCFVAILILVFMRPYKLFSDFCFATLSLIMLLPAAQLSILDPYATGESPFEEIQQLDAIVLTEFCFFVIFLLMEATGCFRFAAKRFPDVLSRYEGTNRRKNILLTNPPVEQATVLNGTDPTRQAVEAIMLGQDDEIIQDESVENDMDGLTSQSKFKQESDEPEREHIGTQAVNVEISGDVGIGEGDEKEQEIKQRDLATV